VRSLLLRHRFFAKIPRNPPRILGFLRFSNNITASVCQFPLYPVYVAVFVALKQSRYSLINTLCIEVSMFSLMSVPDPLWLNEVQPTCSYILKNSEFPVALIRLYGPPCYNQPHAVPGSSAAQSHPRSGDGIEQPVILSERRTSTRENEFLNLKQQPDDYLWVLKVSTTGKANNVFRPSPRSHRILASGRFQ
jgi:hypothetical protein